MSCSGRKKKLITWKSLVINCEIPIDMIYQCIVNIIEPNLRKIRNRVFPKKPWFLPLSLSMYKFSEEEERICEYE